MYGYTAVQVISTDLEHRLKFVITAIYYYINKTQFVSYFVHRRKRLDRFRLGFDILIIPAYSHLLIFKLYITCYPLFCYLDTIWQHIYDHLWLILILANTVKPFQTILCLHFTRKKHMQTERKEHWLFQHNFLPHVFSLCVFYIK